MSPDWKLANEILKQDLKPVVEEAYRAHAEWAAVVARDLKRKHPLCRIEYKDVIENVAQHLEKKMNPTKEQLNEAQLIRRYPEPQHTDGILQLIMERDALEKEKAAASVGPPDLRMSKPDAVERELDRRLKVTDQGLAAVERQLVERIQAVEVWREGVNRDLSRAESKLEAIDTANANNLQSMMERLSKLEAGTRALHELVAASNKVAELTQKKCHLCGAYPK